MIIDGNRAKIRNGRAKPTPRARNIAKISAVPLAKAKPTAVPRKGAEHGVANRVTKAPCMK